METLKVGIIGAGWMGHVHARAYQRLGQHWPDLAVRPELVAVADSSAAAAETFARAHGVATQPISTGRTGASCSPTPTSPRSA